MFWSCEKGVLGLFGLIFAALQPELMLLQRALMKQFDVRVSFAAFQRNRKEH